MEKISENRDHIIVSKQHTKIDAADACDARCNGARRSARRALAERSPTRNGCDCGHALGRVKSLRQVGATNTLQREI